MSIMQLVRQRNAEQKTLATTKVDQVQSLQLVQTMLHGALSIFTYSRGLFPEKVYEERVYQMQDKPLPYEDFAAGRMPTRATQSDGPSTRLQLLQRSRSKRVDVFLDWLEKGAFPELETGDLRAVRVLVHPDKECRSEVIETCTFTIHYTAAEGEERRPNGLTAVTSGDQPVTFEATNTAIQQLFRRVAEVCDHLPWLPNQRMLSMELVYENDTAKKKRIEAFAVSQERNLSFGTANGWRPFSESLKFSSGHHDASLSITSLHPIDESSGHDPSLQIPSGLDFSRSVSRYRDIQLMPPPPIPTVPRTPDPSTAPRKRHASQLQTFERDGAGFRRRYSDGVETQLNFANEMSGALKGMMQPEQITQGDTQTQGTYRSSALEDDVTATPTTVLESPLAATPANRDAFSLLAKTQQKIATSKPDLLKKAKALSQQAGGMTQSGQMILCQCGFGKEEGDMVQCAICSTWQHLHCYGYTGEEDPRLPEEHICYRCLLGDDDPAKYKALQSLAVERRAMYSVSANGMRTKSDLSKDLEIEQEQASSLFNNIKKSGFVTQAARSHKPGYRKSGLPLYVPAETEAARRKLLETYFDPMTHISHHYDVQPHSHANAMRINQRLIASMAKNLPPAADPTHNRPNSLATPGNKGGGSSVAGSAWPVTSTSDAFAGASDIFRTPTPATRGQKQANKRRLKEVEAEAEESANKRAATLASKYTSFRSVKMIDAEADSSPATVQ